MDLVTHFEAERPRLERLAAGLLGDRHEAQDVVQLAWLRLDRTDAQIESLPAWLTTVTTRLCLDRLRARVPEPVDLAAMPHEPAEAGHDPAEEVALADTVGVALQVVLEKLSPAERVAFVLHDTFGVDFGTVAQVLDLSPAAARKQASRARAKVRMFAPDGPPADWEVVDAFLAAARGGDFARLLHLLAPDVVVTADAAAIASGTPERLEGREAVAAMFDGAASAALPTLLEGRPGLAWFHQGRARVAFDFRVERGRVTRITFRAAPDVLAHLVRRQGPDAHPATRRGAVTNPT
ncbi:sigma-70 family RNA polymerase sigma factor [Ornithinimicrobium sp. Y1847]|uniref:sigma-70 family RNA polymerase sigma factor n=1 Tax=Ornithinimicrobium sp. Y1847 TaxID=3405419 RepID=UPI003B67548B